MGNDFFRVMYAYSRQYVSNFTDVVSREILTLYPDNLNTIVAAIPKGDTSPNTIIWEKLLQVAEGGLDARSSESGESYAKFSELAREIPLVDSPREVTIGGAPYTFVGIDGWMPAELFKKLNQMFGTRHKVGSLLFEDSGIVISNFPKITAGTISFLRRVTGIGGFAFKLALAEKKVSKSVVDTVNGTIGNEFGIKAALWALNLIYSGSIK